MPPPSFKLGHNHFSDLTNDEFQKLYSLGSHSNSYMNDIIDQDADTSFPNWDSVEDERRHLQNLPAEIDWVTEGAVTPVKDQGSCGACWSFSAVGALEGAKFKKDGELVELSEQMLMDCDTTNHGCEGGVMTYAFVYTEKLGGLCTEDAYQYIGEVNSKCMASSCSEVVDTKPTSVLNVKSKGIALQTAVAQQPVSAGMQAYLPEFQLYSSGVFNYDKCAADIDHGVLVVGYGHDKELDVDFWKVKNSWGVAWGEEGYFRLERGTDMQYDTCGILKQCSFPIIE